MSRFRCFCVSVFRCGNVVLRRGPFHALWGAYWGDMTQTVEFHPVLTNSDVIGQVSADDAPNVHPEDSQKPPPLRSILTRPVLISVANYATLALLGMISIALIPLIWSTPVEFGGLNLSSASIGLCMSAYGLMNGIFQFAVFPYLVGRFGPRWVFITSIAVCAVVYVMFPFENMVLRSAVDSPVVWLLIFVQLAASSTSKLGYSEPFFRKSGHLARR